MPTGVSNIFTPRRLEACAAALAFALAGCLGHPDDAIEEDPELDSVTQAQRNNNNPNDGKACYVDGAKTGGPKKGEMHAGYCCVPTGPNSKHCYVCSAETECQMGGGDVGAHVDPGSVLGGMGDWGEQSMMLEMRSEP